MADINQDFTLWQNQDALIDFTITGVDATSGAGFHFGISFGAGDNAALVEKTLGSGVTAPDATTVQVEIDAADIADLDPREDYFHELWINDALGKWVPLAEGSLELRGSAVR